MGYEQVEFKTSKGSEIKFIPIENLKQMENTYTKLFSYIDGDNRYECLNVIYYDEQYKKVLHTASTTHKSLMSGGPWYKIYTNIKDVESLYDSVKGKNFFPFIEIKELDILFKHGTFNPEFIIFRNGVGSSAFEELTINRRDGIWCISVGTIADSFPPSVIGTFVNIPQEIIDAKDIEGMYNFALEVCQKFLNHRYNMEQSKKETLFANIQEVLDISK